MKTKKIYLNPTTADKSGNSKKIIFRKGENCYCNFDEEREKLCLCRHTKTPEQVLSMSSKNDNFKGILR